MLLGPASFGSATTRTLCDRQNPDSGLRSRLAQHGLDHADHQPNYGRCGDCRARSRNRAGTQTEQVRVVVASEFRVNNRSALVHSHA